MCLRQWCASLPSSLLSDIMLEFEISHSGSIYTTELCKCYKSGTFAPTPPALVVKCLLARSWPSYTSHIVETNTGVRKRLSSVSGSTVWMVCLPSHPYLSRLLGKYSLWTLRVTPALHWASQQKPKQVSRSDGVCHCVENQEAGF